MAASSPQLRFQVLRAILKPITRDTIRFFELVATLDDRDQHLRSRFHSRSPSFVRSFVLRYSNVCQPFTTYYRCVLSNRRLNLVLKLFTSVCSIGAAKGNDITSSIHCENLMPTRIRSVLRSREGCFTAYARRGDGGPPRGRRTLTGREASQEDYRKQIISVEILLANSLDTLPRSNVSATELSRAMVSANGRSVASSRFARDFPRKFCRCRYRRPRNVRVSLRRGVSVSIDNEIGRLVVRIALLSFMQRDKLGTFLARRSYFFTRFANRLMEQ